MKPKVMQKLAGLGSSDVCGLMSSGLPGTPICRDLSRFAQRVLDLGLAMVTCSGTHHLDKVIDWRR
jgi:hypothetical protein